MPSIQNDVRKLEMYDISTLEPFQGKLKSLSDTNKEKLKKTIRTLNFSEPIIIWKSKGQNYIINGHQRVTVLKELHEDGEFDGQVPCVEISAKDEKEAKQKVLSLTSQYGEISNESLENYMHEAGIQWLDAQETYRFPEVTLFDEQDQEIEYMEGEDDVPAVDETKTITTLGDVWILGNHRVMCGDSTVITDVEKLMDGQKADMMFTDPPYNVASDSKNFAADVSKSMNDLKNAEWDKNFDIKKFFKLFLLISKKSCTYYIWSNHFLISEIWDCFKDNMDFYSYIVWSKPNPMPSLSKKHPTWNTELCAYGTRGSDRVVNFPNKEHFLSCREVVKKSDGSHPTQKPIELIQPLLEFSSDKNQLIVDLFGGSGSTLIACEKTNRKCFMMELDPKYCDVIIKRWQDFTGKDAINEETKMRFDDYDDEKMNKALKR